MKRGLSMGLAVMMMAVSVLGCGKGGQGSSESPEKTQESGAVTEKIQAEELKVAVIGEPSTLDVHMTSAFITQEIGYHILEGLYTIDGDYNTVPMLAEDTKVSEDNTHYTIRLRKGVTFHNGKELTAQDVEASLKRWVEKTSYGAILGKILDKIQVTDDYTVELYLTEPSVVVTTLLAFPNQQGGIYPKESIEAAGEKGIPEEYIIGTGPYRFLEHRPDQYVKLAKYQEYCPREEEPSGHGGRKTAYFEQLTFIPVSEDAVRKDGVSTGEYHFGEQISTDMYDLVEMDPASEPVVIKPWWWPMMVLNKKEGIFANVKARQALLACLDMEACMKAAFGNELFYRIDCSAMFQEQPMYSEGGKDMYNQHDVEKAKALLAETDYKGEPVVWYTTKDYPYMYKIAVVASQQMKEAGFNVDVQVVDWATITQVRNDPSAYNIFSGATTFTPDPGVLPHLDGTWPGWWENEEKDQMIVELNAQADEEKRQQIWDEFQETWIWGDVPFIKIGDYFLLSSRSKDLKNFDEGPFTFFWNCYLEK
ncbi:MAG: ABC transporter substrate-binding protein [Hungatella sp.]|jgi:peptide/nickel transport system substrate-binding protein|nr:ABC transporter substrate-binding protein [Hungatella sp.]